MAEKLAEVTVNVATNADATLSTLLGGAEIAWTDLTGPALYRVYGVVNANGSLTSILSGTFGIQGVSNSTTSLSGELVPAIFAEGTINAVGSLTGVMVGPTYVDGVINAVASLSADLDLMRWRPFAMERTDVIFTGITDLSLNGDEGVYTDSNGKLTSGIPSTGTLGFWKRSTGPNEITQRFTSDSLKMTGGSITLTSGVINVQTPVSGVPGISCNTGHIQTSGSTSSRFKAGTGFGSGATYLGKYVLASEGGSQQTDFSWTHIKGFGSQRYHININKDASGGTSALRYYDVNVNELLWCDPELPQVAIGGTPTDPYYLFRVYGRTWLNNQLSVNGNILGYGWLNVSLAGVAKAKLFGLQQRSHVTIDHTDSPHQLDETQHTILVDCSGGNVQVNLPVASDFTYDGSVYNIKRIDSSTNTCTVSGAVGDNIDGSGTGVTLYPLETITVHNDSDDWWII